MALSSHCGSFKEGFPEKEMGGVGKERRGSDGASECPGDTGQKRVKLLEGESTYNNWRRKVLGGSRRNYEVNRGVIVIVGRKTLQDLEMKPKNRVSKSLLLLNPAIIHEAPPHSNQASPSRIWASGAFPSPACVPAPSTGTQPRPIHLGHTLSVSAYRSEAPGL